MTGVNQRIADLYAIVPAGGAGTRLWPLSRSSRPKFLLDLAGTGRSLLQKTWDRLEPVVGADGIVVVTGVAHANAVAAQLPSLSGANLIAEPAPRDSAAAIGLAAAILNRRHPGCLVGSFAADQVMADEPAFHDAVRQAAAVARTGDVVTLGITPTYPATGFGYVHCGAALAVAGAPSALRVSSFVEKPDAETAAAWLATGEYRWNAGIFLSRADVLLDLLEACRPELHAGLVEIAAAYDGERRQEVLQRLWPTLEKVAIDYAVAEPAAGLGRVAVIPTDPGWDDIGDFAALAGLLPLACDGPPAVRVLGEKDLVLAESASGLVAPVSGRLVAVLGLDDVIVVDTPDAVLVTTRSQAQRVKALVDALAARGRHDLL